MNPDTALVEQNAALISAKVVDWGRANFRDYAWRDTSNKWLALVAEIMLQRTRATTVEPVWFQFKEKFDSPEKLTDAEPAELFKLFRPLGLSWRVKHVIALANGLAASEEIPLDKTDLKALPGVGEYISSAYLSLHAGQRHTIVDSNVVRWICRLVGTDWDGETRRRQWLRGLADIITPASNYRDYNYGVLDLTMTVCVKSPKCEECPVSDFCKYYSTKVAD